MNKLARMPRRVSIDPDSRAPKLDVVRLRRLADFRFRLRYFLHVSQAAAEEMGLHNQQYQLLQCVGGMPEGMAPTIANVAARMLLKHNSAVELVDRSVEQGLLRRSGDEADHRRILLRVTPQGERMLARWRSFTRASWSNRGRNWCARSTGFCATASEAPNAADERPGKRQKRDELRRSPGKNAAWRLQRRSAHDHAERPGPDSGREPARRWPGFCCT